MSDSTDAPPAAGPAADMAGYLGRFRRSHKGNLVLKGWITDTGAEGMPSVPFQLVVFTSQGGTVPLDRWTWGIVIDPRPQDAGDDKQGMEFSNEGYPDANSAALAARAMLLEGGLMMNDEAPAMVGVRQRIKAAAARRSRDL